MSPEMGLGQFKATPNCNFVARYVWTDHESELISLLALLLKEKHWNLHNVRWTIPNDVLTSLNLNQISQIKYSNIETELNVMKNLNKIIKSKSKSG